MTTPRDLERAEAQLREGRVRGLANAERCRAAIGQNHVIARALVQRHEFVDAFGGVAWASHASGVRRSRTSESASA